VISPDIADEGPQLLERDLRHVDLTQGNHAWQHTDNPVEEAQWAGWTARWR